MPNYMFGHFLSSSTMQGPNFRTKKSRYDTQPFDFDQPQEGSVDIIVHCISCNEDVKVTVFSNKEIWKKRIKYWWVILGCILFWLIYILIMRTTGYGYILNEWSGILGIITFFVVVWQLRKIVDNWGRLMFEINPPGHAILWDKKK